MDRRKRARTLEKREEGTRKKCESAKKDLIFCLLPSNILIHIFSFLPLQDRKNVRRVCKLCHALSNHPSLVKHDVTVLPSYRNLGTTFDFHARYENIYFDLRNDDELYSHSDIEKGNAFWKLHGHNVKSLHISAPGYHFRLIFPILRSCPRLKRIYLVTSELINQPYLTESDFEDVSFKKLNALKVRGDQNFVIPILKFAILNAPLLKRIAVCCDYCPCAPNTCPLNSLNVAPAAKLNIIHVRSPCIDDKFINMITESLGSRLKKFSFPGANLSKLSLEYLSKCPNLKKLTIEKCMYAEPVIYKDIITKLTKLTAVSFLKSRNITNYDLEPLGGLLNLSHVELSFCPNISNEGVNLIIGNTVRPKIVELRLSFTCITNDLLYKIAPLLPNLQILDLSYCSKITNVSLAPILKYNRSLRCLSVRECEKFNTHPLGLPFFNDLKELVHLSNNTLTQNNMISWGLKYLELPKLKVLNSNCHVPLWMIPLIQKQCPSLMYLNATGSFKHFGINDDVLNRKQLISFRYCKSAFGQCFLLKNHTLITLI